MSGEGKAGRGSFYCPSCDEHVDPDLLVYFGHTDRHVIEAIKLQFPGWVEADGACPK